MRGYADMILRAVCDFYSRPDAWGEVTPQRLASKETDWPMEEARGVLAYLWYEAGGLRNTEIAARIRRDEPTTLRMRRHVADRLRRDDIALAYKVLPAITARLEELRHARSVPPGAPSRTSAR